MCGEMNLFFSGNFDSAGTECLWHDVLIISNPLLRYAIRYLRVSLRKWLASKPKASGFHDKRLINGCNFCPQSQSYKSRIKEAIMQIAVSADYIIT